jgi:hypothetical protein
MITAQIKKLVRRYAALSQLRAHRDATQQTEPKGRSLRFYLVLASILGLGLSLATADTPNPTPGPSQPVREQNLDPNGLIRVHEQGTANVNVTNVPLPVSGTVNADVTGSIVRATIPPATTSFSHNFILTPPFISDEMSFPTINASAIHVQLGDFNTETQVFFKSPLVDAGFGQGLFFLRVEPAKKGDLITFTQPVPINGVEVRCTQAVLSCSALVSVVGAPTAP